MSEYGVAIGIVVLIIVIATALLLARKAEQGVRTFRHEDHDQFLGEQKP